MDLGRDNVRTVADHRMLERLSPRVRDAADAAYELFLINPAHPGLALHELTDTRNNRFIPGSFSVRVTMQYRAVAFIDGTTNVWYWIGSHGGYDARSGRH